ncbi:hypothetical protein PHYPSEUDO_009577 [Phytophthora pseudosyringae]|uniref:Uncharacterized protein n=1 Tax=Phytophthora pseudosyringae TaxID=221518 RepID=A0A8T1WN16_9STRA|nr:hypothetical protein PHYPSEUDO_009577 [Phytophthora pseudosyringae]
MTTQRAPVAFELQPVLSAAIARLPQPRPATHTIAVHRPASVERSENSTDTRNSHVQRRAAARKSSRDLVLQRAVPPLAVVNLIWNLQIKFTTVRDLPLSSEINGATCLQRNLASTTLTG